MENSVLRPIYNLVTTLISLTGIALISSGIFDLKIPFAASNQSIENLTLPANFTFAIWGILYFGFLLYSIYQFLPSQLDNPRVRRTESYITLSIQLNFAWALLTGMGFQIVPYCIQWMTLLLSLFILSSYGAPNPNRSSIERMIYAIFAMYCGWLTVAIIPSTTELILRTGWRGEPLTPTLIAIAVYAFATGIVLLAFREIKHTWYLLPLVWLFIGYGVKFSGTLAWTAGSLAVMVGLLFLYKLIQSTRAMEQSNWRGSAYNPFAFRSRTLDRLY
jgi:hypothetical protein